MRASSRWILQIMWLVALAALATTAAVDVHAQKRATPSAAQKAAKDVPPPTHLRRCEVGQVLKFDGGRWVCADDLVGAGEPAASGPRLVDANGTTVGPVLGTASHDGATVVNVLVTAAGDAKPFLLAADEGGFVRGRLYLPSNGEAFSCALSCGLGTDLPCVEACLTASPVCDPGNARVVPGTGTGGLFRAGVVAGANADLWVTTSSVLAPVGECSATGGIPSCATVVYGADGDRCTLDIRIGSSEPMMTSPAAPVAGLHLLYPPPYALRPQ